MQVHRTLGLLTAILTALTATSARAQSSPAQTVQSAEIVLKEAMTSAGSRIPASMLSDCHGVAIIPNVIKGGFIVGARHGKGLLFVRDADGSWHAPVFVSLTGGNIGWQVGVQASDIVLVFKTARSVEGILSGKLTIGGDAAAAAGPVGRQTAVATDGQLKAEIYTYSRSRGLFAGVSIDGSVLKVDQLSTGTYYQSSDPTQPTMVPPAALQLTQTVAAYAAATPASATSAATSESAVGTIVQPLPASSPQGTPALAEKYGASEADVVRGQLEQLGPALFQLLDPQWQTYLALPLAAQGQSHPDSQTVAQSLKNYELIANDPRFAQLAARPEFRSVYGLLKHYEHALSPQKPVLQLPPPPQAIAQ